MRGYKMMIAACIIVAIVLTLSPPTERRVDGGYHPCCLVGFSHGSHSTQSMRQAIVLALEKLGKPIRDAGLYVELSQFDHQGKADSRLRIAKEISANKRIFVVIASSHAVFEPELATYNEAKLAVILPDVLDVGLSTLSFPNTVSLVGGVERQGVVAADFATSVGAKAPYVIHDNSLHGQAVARQFVESLGSVGIKPIKVVVIDEKAADFAGLAVAMKGVNPDLVFFGGSQRQAGVLVKQARERGVTAKFLGTNRIDSPVVAELAGRNVVGVNYISLGGPPALHPGAKAFSEEYKKRFGTEPEPFAVHAYDAGAIAVGALVEAIKSAGGKVPTRDQVVQALRNVKANGLTGSIEFNERGEVRRAKYFVMEVVASDPSKWDNNRSIYEKEVSR